jgi:hypothetical protein
MAIISTTSSWDPQINDWVTTTIDESFTGFATIPSNAIDASTTLSEGKYVTTYKQQGYSSGGSSPTPSTTNYSYTIHSSTSQEPLITHAIFQTGGTYALTDDDKNKIKLAEADPTLWNGYKSSSSAGLAQYATLILAGQESYLNAGVTLTITSDETALPNLTTVGHIATVSNAPTLASGCNWLFTGCSAEALSGGKWRISREYRSSGTKGWNSTIYS